MIRPSIPKSDSTTFSINRLQLRAFALALLLAISLPAMTATFGGVASADTNNWTSEDFEDGDAAGWELEDGTEPPVIEESFYGDYSMRLDGEQTEEVFWVDGPTLSTQDNFELSGTYRPDGTEFTHRLGIANTEDTFEGAFLVTDIDENAIYLSTEFDGDDDPMEHGYVDDAYVGEWVDYRIQITSGEVRAKAWPSAESEPDDWQMERDMPQFESEFYASAGKSDGGDRVLDIDRLEFSNNIAGQVTDQNNEPVSNASVYATSYDTADPPQIDDRDIDDLLNNPFPEEWEEQLDEFDDFSTDEFTPTDDSIDEKRVVMHTAEDWDTRDTDLLLFIDDVFDFAPTDIPARPVTDADDTQVFSVWEPSGDLTADVIDSSYPGIKTTQTDAIVIERVDPLGDSVETRTVTPVRAFSLFHPSNCGESADTPTCEKAHYIAAVDLDKGMYRVYPEDSPEQSMFYAVADDGDIDTLQADLRNWALEEEEAVSAFNEEMQELFDAGNIDISSTTTDENGEFELTAPMQVDQTELVAIDDAGALNIDPEDLSRTSLRNEYQSAVESNFNDQTGQDPVEYIRDNPREQFRSECREMSSIADETGAPFIAHESTSVPNDNVQMQGYRAIPPDVDGVIRECAAVNIVDSLLDDGLGYLDSGLLDDIENMSPAELEDAMNDLLALVQGSDALADEVEERTGVELDSDDAADYTDEEIKQVINDGYEVIDSGSDNVPGSGGIGGGTDSDTTLPTVDPPETGVDEVDETLEAIWPVGNVDDWEEAGLLIRLDFADGTTETITAESEYVTIEERTVGPDLVRLEEYPLGDEDPASVVPRLDVSTDEGVGGNTGEAERNPAFDGEIPAVDSFSLSSFAPGPSQSVSVGVASEDPIYNDISDLTVTGPDGQDIASSIENGDATFTTDGEGTYRVAAVVENEDGVQFTEVVRVRAGQTAQDRNPSIRASSGPIGRYAIVGDGFERGELDVSDGRSSVKLTGILASDADDPRVVHGYTTGMDLARDTTTTMTVRRGDAQEHVDGSIGMVLHAPVTSEETLHYREDRPLVADDETTEGAVDLRSDATVYDTFSRGEEATVEIRQIEDPTIVERTWHWARLNVPLMSIGIPVPSLPSLPAPIAVGGGPLAVLAGGVIVARRVRS